ncbi:hypothetical protein LJC58_08235 [Lachnospiraceae bacterium OttesenSCG-928-D06]|nr:hypothetical protein [Lachnospiraceae bacterium OttesenSCG-928-D06]
MIMVLCLEIPNNGEFRLEFDGKIQKFAQCRLRYSNDSCQTQIYEDYLYILVESILGRIKNIPEIKHLELIGTVGKWQEYFYFNSTSIKRNKKEIEQMEKSIFVSTEYYGTFLYRCFGKIWLEVNKGYSEDFAVSPEEYYDSSKNYQILLAPISEDIIGEWEKMLNKISKKLT